MSFFNVQRSLSDTQMFGEKEKGSIFMSRAVWCKTYKTYSEQDSSSAELSQWKQGLTARSEGENYRVSINPLC